MKKRLFTLLFITMAFSQFDNTIAGWYNGAFYVPDGTVYSEGVTVVNEGTLAAETLDEVDFASNVTWGESGDFTYAAGVNFEFVWTAWQTSALEQVDADFLVVAVGSCWYKFTYTIAVTTVFDGDGAATITTAFALTAVDLDLSAGTHTVYFKSAVAPTDFLISVVSGSDTEGTFTIDDVTLKQIQGGSVDISGVLLVRGVDIGAAVGAGSDNQTIDVFSISGNNVQLSLEDDGEATKTVDISSTTAVAANSAKNTNVPTTLSIGTTNANTVAITSDGGADDVTIPAAINGTAGLLTDAKWDEIVVNTGKTGVTGEISNVVEDISPQLGANLDVQAFNLTGTGLWQAGTVAFGKGGTGLTSWTQYLIPYAATTTSIGQIAIGNAGDILTSAGAGVAPSFQAAAGGGDFSDGGDAGGANRTLGNTDNFTLGFETNNVERAQFTTAGHFLPIGTHTYDLGSAAADWNNAYLAILYSGTAYFDGLLMHTGDADTRINFTTDKLQYSAGGVEFMSMTEAASDAISFAELSDINIYSNSFNYDYGNKDWDWGTSVRTHYGANSTVTHNAKVVTYDSGTTTLYCDRGNYQFLTFGAGNITTLDFADMVASEVIDITLVITQDGTGSRTIGTWDAAIDWEGGAAPTLTATGNAADVLNFIVNGTGIIYGKLLSADVR